MDYYINNATAAADYYYYCYYCYIKLRGCRGSDHHSDNFAPLAFPCRLTYVRYTKSNNG